jgi:N-acetylmuramoyl-L-alanine amidase
LPRPRRSLPLLSLAAALAIGPLLAATALAADPTIVVRSGDTLTGISRRYDVPIARIVELNDLRDPNRIYAGQRLRLRAERRAPATSAGREGSTPAAVRHTVRPGEHLTGIARRYGVTIAAIVKANGLADPSRIYAGQRLTIPGAAAATRSSRSSPARPSSGSGTQARATHTVQLGEHLIGIARRYGVTVEAIVAANGIVNPSRIYAGQRLTIPGTRPPAARATRPSVPASMRALMQRRERVRRVIVQEARRFDVPPPLALAVAWQESGWQQKVVSTAGAIGVMQLLPATGEWVGGAMLGTRVDLRDTRQNVRAGVRLLGHYLHRYDGNIDLVLAAYYQGQTAADRHGVYPVSRPYIASIRTLVRLLGG